MKVKAHCCGACKLNKFSPIVVEVILNSACIYGGNVLIRTKDAESFQCKTDLKERREEAVDGDVEGDCMYNYNCVIRREGFWGLDDIGDVASLKSTLDGKPVYPPLTKKKMILLIKEEKNKVEV